MSTQSLNWGFTTEQGWKGEPTEQHAERVLDRQLLKSTYSLKIYVRSDPLNSKT
jgi:hypothetical protein